MQAPQRRWVFVHHVPRPARAAGREREGDHDLEVSDVGCWVAHPGGPKVLHAMTRTLGLPPDALDRTWRSLEQVGNLSSASVLHVLGTRLAEPRAPAATYDVMLAMGPGFCSELVLLRW